MPLQLFPEKLKNTLPDILKAMQMSDDVVMPVLQRCALEVLSDSRKKTTEPTTFGDLIKLFEKHFTEAPATISTARDYFKVWWKHVAQESASLERTFDKGTLEDSIQMLVRGGFLREDCVRNTPARAWS